MIFYLLIVFIQISAEVNLKDEPNGFEQTLHIECSKNTENNLVVDAFFRSKYQYLLYAFEWSFSDGEKIEKSWGKKSVRHVFSVSDDQHFVSVKLYRYLSHKNAIKITRTVECFKVCEMNNQKSVACLKNEKESPCCNGNCCKNSCQKCPITNDFICCNSENEKCFGVKNNTKQICCPNEESICNNNCCSEKEQCFKNRICCQKDSVCGELCCPKDSVCIEGICCPNKRSCGPTCCKQGYNCVDGKCCPNENICNGMCCPSNEGCYSGECCVSEDVCGEECCSNDGYCCLGKCVKSSLYCCHNKNGEEDFACEVECCGKLEHDICCPKTDSKCKMDSNGAIFCKNWKHHYAEDSLPISGGNSDGSIYFVGHWS